jgi:hypothetical protein
VCVDERVGVPDGIAEDELGVADDAGEHVS